MRATTLLDSGVWDKLYDLDIDSEVLDRIAQEFQVFDIAVVDLNGRNTGQLLDEFEQMGRGAGEKFGPLWYFVNREISLSLMGKGIEVDQPAIKWLGFTIATKLCSWMHEWLKEGEENAKAES